MGHSLLKKDARMDSQSGQKMWGGRFSAKPSDVMQQINASIDIDQRLWREDIAGSRAHAAMLAETGIISASDRDAILDGLTQIAGEIEAGTFHFSKALEDIHMNIEARLVELVGEAGKRVHTARSRNDQVVTDFKLWVRGALAGTIEGVKGLQRALVVQAQAHADWIMPGFTHLQSAQPVTLGHHLMAYVEMLGRDVRRFEAALQTADTCPLGAAALAGTGFPIDREMTARALGFSAPMANSLDAVSSRDFAMEALAALAISSVHLSRLAEEIVLWSSAPFSFCRLDDAWSTGSSIMPQKRNPDAAELVRAKAARLTANFGALANAVKCLPLAYAKDLQDDKATTFEAFDAFALSVAAMKGMIETITFNRAPMRAAAANGFSTATDLADWLVRSLGLPFREAHHVTGALVKLAETEGRDLPDLSLAQMQSVHAGITEDVFAYLTVEQSVASRISFGGTAPLRVKEQAALWQAALGKDN
jgi:argininosuccinate lyase